MDEMKRLDSIAEDYDPSSPAGDFDYWFVRFAFETIARNIVDGATLELGCSTGLMTKLLYDVTCPLVVVDGSSSNIERTRQLVGASAGVEYIHQLWEDFVPDRRYENIVLVRGLEHVREPVDLLSRSREWLTAGGRIHVIVPNARSLHRRIGVYMGLLRDVHELHEGDLRVGHYRVYDRELLFRELSEAGLTPRHWEGIMLKPLANAQMQEWPENLIRAFYQAGRELPDYCGEIYVWCKA